LQPAAVAAQRRDAGVLQQLRQRARGDVEQIARPTIAVGTRNGVLIQLLELF
jgi:hypothetical protein